MSEIEFDSIFSVFDNIIPGLQKDQEEFDFAEFQTTASKSRYPTRKEVEKMLKKNDMYIGAEFDSMENFIGHATLKMKDLTVHQITYAVSGSGKTVKMEFFLCWLLIFKDVANDLKKKGEGEFKVFDSVILDNLGNFAKFGDPFLQDRPEFLAPYIKAGWTPDYLRSLGLKWVQKYQPNGSSKLSLWRPSRIVPNLKSSLHFTEYLKFLGVELSGVLDIIYKTLVEMGFFDKDFDSLNFRFDEFYKILRRERNAMIQLSKTFKSKSYEEKTEKDFENIEKLYMKIAVLEKIIAPLQCLDRDYKGVFEPPQFEDNKITIQNCVSTSDRWLFQTALVEFLYYQYAKKESNLQSIKLMVSTDEYNDILDDQTLVNSRDFEDRREGFLADVMRTLFLRLVREGRNFGSPVNLATQNPSQLLQKESRKFSSIQNVFVGYMGREIDRLEKNKNLDTSFGDADTVRTEAISGWISKKATGRWLLITETGVRYIQTGLGFYQNLT